MMSDIDGCIWYCGCVIPKNPSIDVVMVMAG